MAFDPDLMNEEGQFDLVDIKKRGLPDDYEAHVTNDWLNESR
jgi:hypothetical protein